MGMIDMTEGEADYLKYRFKQYLGSVSREIQNRRLQMNHDYAHCADYKKGVCPTECFRGQLVRDLNRHPMLKNISFASFKGTDECELKEQEDGKV